MIQAMRNKVVILPNEGVDETPSGLKIIGSYNPELGLRRGKVVSVGLGCKELKEGDEACYIAFSGIAIHYEGVRYLTMFEAEVVGKTSSEIKPDGAHKNSEGRVDIWENGEVIGSQG